ncbi:MAG: hypothetical protein AMJ90_06275 [candidate division Zixibacteria bacterium SM23_73_2]|nr:MAG: hypothetical protein AMJ90_06275 [candidate division Zixibacteria bacterium SM23_73_2]
MRYYKEIILVLASLFLLFTILSCSKTSTGSKETDQSALLSLISSNPDFFGSCVIDSTTPDTSGLGKVYAEAEDTVKAWWRMIRWSQTQRTVTIDVFPSDDVHTYPFANVSITDTLQGDLRIIRKSSSGGWHHISKPIKDVAQRNAYFERRGFVNSLHRGWRLIEVSGLLVESSDCTREIDSVRIQSSNSQYDTTITQDYITDSHLLEDLFTFDLKDSITLTVYTTDPKDSVYLHAFSHLFPHLFNVRRSFDNNGDGSFSGTWVTRSDIADMVAYRHAAIDVIKHSTLDGEDPYDSKAWGIIYRLKDL